MHVKPKRDIASIRPTGPALGIMPGAVFDSARIQLQPGDTLIGFTDGVIDARPDHGTAFGREGVVSVIRRSDASGRRLMQAIVDAARNHLNHSDLTDDIAMVALLRDG
jgi:sigma-B regulation protein RsbU (phosphoserine phosphatase)